MILLSFSMSMPMPFLTVCFGDSAGVAFASHWMYSSFWLIIVWVCDGFVGGDLGVQSVAAAKLILLCVIFAANFFSLIFRRVFFVLALAAVAGASSSSTDRVRLFPDCASTSIAGCASPFVLSSSSLWTVVASLFFAAGGVTVVLLSVGVAVLAPLARGGV